ncbi:sure-like protein [Trametes sanguinea]|nr:sure-like protein [Trametes sanguinea]
MQFPTNLFTLLVLSLSVGRIAAQAIPTGPSVLLTNADGWATSAVRAQGGALFGGNFNLVLSAPAQIESKAGSKSAPAKPLKKPCEFDSCPAGSPAEGSDPTDGRLNFVNSYPVDAVKYGIQTVSPQYLNSTPDFVVSGVDSGNAVGAAACESGTLGAAAEAAKEGIPSAAFSGASIHPEYYNTSDPTSANSVSASLYSNLSVALLTALFNSTTRPVLPAGTTLNVNFAHTSLGASKAKTKCATSSDFKWVFTRVVPASKHAKDVETCGGTHLPDEETVVHSGCYATVSVVNATTKEDVDAATQSTVLERLKPAGLFTCFKH